AQGYNCFLAVGGDGTAFEIVNGLFPRDTARPRPSLGFLPLGTGNSFLRDFTSRGAEHAVEALLAGRRRACDVLRLTHSRGELYFINLLTLGFAADVAYLVNRRFKRLGELGYILGVLVCLARLNRRAFPLRVDQQASLDQRRCLFLAFSNSKFTGGKMMIAPNADPSDGLIEYVRWGPIRRLGLIRNFSTLFTGEHIHHPLASRSSVRRIDFDLEGPVEVTLDGDSMHLECKSVEVVPGALDVLA
ncbi:MAG: diacylglycerol/lipid kinase family protein, partial [Candidatus Acidiferrales bacterium]